MTVKDISFIIPVYNRPNELNELLISFKELITEKDFEIVIVEDGSSITSEDVIQRFKDELNITYLFKKNSGPGHSRNYGMIRARGNYFIILDSDCILPKNYLEKVLRYLNESYVDCFGGPDAAHDSFSNLQKAINFSMTSIITTGGIRGNKNAVDKFQPRSFNMGLSKEAFLATRGFGTIHPGEDPDLSIRLWKLNYKTALYPEAYVYHKRRISWSKFFRQVYKFGMVRQILNHWHPDTKKITYWFPTIFCLGLIISIVLLFGGITLPVMMFVLYFTLNFILALIGNKNIIVSLLAVIAVIVQFFGYGYGFLRSWIIMCFSKKDIEHQFPNLFFKTDQNVS